MQTITLPIWALAASVGLPTICLFWIVTALVRRRRKIGRVAAENKAATPMTAPMPGPGNFRQDLLAQQVDIVFSGLTALIETERIKLNALLSQNLYPTHPMPQTMPMTEHLNPAEPDTSSADDGDAGNLLGRQVADAVASGQGVDHVATQLGLSHAEVALAMKLNQSKTDTPNRRLEAVA